MLKFQINEYAKTQFDLEGIDQSISLKKWKFRQNRLKYYKVGLAAYFSIPLWRLWVLLQAFLHVLASLFYDRKRGAFSALVVWGVEKFWYFPSKLLSKFQFLSVSKKIVVVGFGVCVLFSISIFPSVVSLDILKFKNWIESFFEEGDEEANPQIPKETPEPPIIVSADPIKVTPVFPTGSEPYSWQYNSIQRMVGGRKIKVSTLGDVCQNEVIVVRGSASANGADQVNRFISRQRSKYLNDLLRSELDRCFKKPKILMVAKYGLTGLDDDMSQRQVLAFSVRNFDVGSDLNFDEYEQLEKLAVSNTTSGELGYSFAEYCWYSASVSCEWKSMEISQ